MLSSPTWKKINSHLLVLSQHLLYVHTEFVIFWNFHCKLANYFCVWRGKLKTTLAIEQSVAINMRSAPVRLVHARAHSGVFYTYNLGTWKCNFFVIILQKKLYARTNGAGVWQLYAQLLAFICRREQINPISVARLMHDSLSPTACLKSQFFGVALWNQAKNVFYELV